MIHFPGKKIMLQKIVQKLIECRESHLKSVNNQNFIWVNLVFIWMSSRKIQFKSLWMYTGYDLILVFVWISSQNGKAQILLNVYLLWSECKLIFIWILKSKSTVQIPLNMYLFWSKCTIKAHWNKFLVVWMLTVLNGCWLWSIHQ